jgi:hypothetical protein
MLILEAPLDTAPVTPEAIAARTKAARTAEFELRIVRADDGPPPDVRALNVTLKRHAFSFGTAFAPEVVQLRYGDDAHWLYGELAGDHFNRCFGDCVGSAVELFGPGAVGWWYVQPACTLLRTAGPGQVGVSLQPRAPPPSSHPWLAPGSRP